jgi:hypothetical protein
MYAVWLPFKQMLKREQEVQMATERRRTEAGRRRQNTSIHHIRIPSVLWSCTEIRKEHSTVYSTMVSLRSLYGSSTEQLNSDAGNKKRNKGNVGMSIPV